MELINFEARISNRQSTIGNRLTDTPYCECAVFTGSKFHLRKFKPFRAQRGAKIFDFAFDFLRKFKPFRAQRGAKNFDFAFDFLRKSKPFRAQRGTYARVWNSSAPPNFRFLPLRDLPPEVINPPPDYFKITPPGPTPRRTKPPRIIRLRASQRHFEVSILLRFP